MAERPHLFIGVIRYAPRGAVGSHQSLVFDVAPAPPPSPPTSGSPSTGMLLRLLMVVMLVVSMILIFIFCSGDLA